jgi:hypothetical protein
MSINDSRIPEKIKCLKLLRDMKINTDEVEIRGYHLFFTYDNNAVVCKIGEDILFDFIDFENVSEAKEYFHKQREKVSVKIHKVKRFREEQICIRSIFNQTIF